MNRERQAEIQVTKPRRQGYELKEFEVKDNVSEALAEVIKKLGNKEKVLRRIRELE